MKNYELRIFSGKLQGKRGKNLGTWKLENIEDLQVLKKREKEERET